MYKLPLSLAVKTSQNPMGGTTAAQLRAEMINILMTLVISLVTTNEF
jgi:hypothetical protein